jgi:hypothetical protein
MRAQEIRGYLRSLDNTERLHLLNQTRDADILSAVANAPALLSGVRDDFRAAILERNIREEHGGRLDILDEMEAAVGEVEGAIKVATDDLRRLSGLDETEFSEIADRRQG